MAVPGTYGITRQVVLRAIGNYAWLTRWRASPAGALAEESLAWFARRQAGPLVDAPGAVGAFGNAISGQEEGCETAF